MVTLAITVKFNNHSNTVNIGKSTHKYNDNDTENNDTLTFCLLYFTELNVCVELISINA